MVFAFSVKNLLRGEGFFIRQNLTETPKVENAQQIRGMVEMHIYRING